MFSSHKSSVSLYIAETRINFLNIHRPKKQISNDKSPFPKIKRMSHLRVKGSFTHLALPLSMNYLVPLHTTVILTVCYINRHSPRGYHYSESNACGESAASKHTDCMVL